MMLHSLTVEQQPMSTQLILQQPAIYSLHVDNHTTLNQQLVEGFLQHRHRDDIKQSHFFHQRYENIYLDESHIAAIAKIKDAAIMAAAKILKQSDTGLKAGLWFNAMEKGHITTAHRHDDDDELLSAVYYIQVPENSGELEFTHQRCTTYLQPEAGLMVFFPPDLMHRVLENKSDQLRLSLGINIGPLNQSESLF